MESKTYRQSWELPHSADKVWRALTESDLLAKWVLPNDMRPIVGHKFTFQAEPNPHWDGTVYCKVLSVEPKSLLRYSWQGAKNAEGGFLVDTVVTWKVSSPRAGVTLLSIEQSGFSPHAPQAYHGAKLGWERYIKTLNQILD